MLRDAKQLQLSHKAFAPCPQDKAAVKSWLMQAVEKFRDADNATVSLGTRFEAAYDALFFIALAALNAGGWKSRSVDGHHQFVLEAVCALLSASEATFDQLDAIRDTRNQKYAGASRTKADLAEAMNALNAFQALATGWLQARHPSLLKP